MSAQKVRDLTAEVEGFLPQSQNGLTLPDFGAVLMLIIQSVYKFAQSLLGSPEFDHLAEQAIRAIMSLYDAWDIFPNNDTVFERLMKDRGRVLLEQGVRDAFAFVRGVHNGNMRLRNMMDYSNAPPAGPETIDPFPEVPAFETETTDSDEPDTDEPTGKPKKKSKK
jgi:hypothetical protein